MVAPAARAWCPSHGPGPGGLRRYTLDGPLLTKRLMVLLRHSRFLDGVLLYCEGRNLLVPDHHHQLGEFYRPPSTPI